MADPRTEELREMAEHRGLRLVRSRRRKPGGDFGRYGLVDRRSGKDVFGVGKRGLQASDEEIERFLRGQDVATWKSSAKAARTVSSGPERPPRPPRDPLSTHPRSAARHKARPASPAPSPAAKGEPEPELEFRKGTKADVATLARLVGELSGGVERAGLQRQMAALARQKAPLLVADKGGWSVSSLTA